MTASSSEATVPASEKQLRSKAPLSLYLNKLLDPSTRPQEKPAPAPAPTVEAPQTPAKPADSESTWQRAKNTAARTLRAAAPLRQKREETPTRSATRGPDARSTGRPKAASRPSARVAGNGRQKVMMVMIPLLAGTLIFLVKNPLKVAPAVQTQETASSIGAPTANPDIQIAWEIPPLYPPGGRDPMRLPEIPAVAVVAAPVVAPAPTVVELHVTGILYSEDRPAAIVDTQLVHEGEQVSGATVRKIEKDGVEFEMNSRTWKQAVETQ